MSQMTATDVFTGAQSWESLPTVDISGWAAKSDEEKIAAALNVVDIVTTKEVLLSLRARDKAKQNRRRICREQGLPPPARNI